MKPTTRFRTAITGYPFRIKSAQRPALTPNYCGSIRYYCGSIRSSSAFRRGVVVLVTGHGDAHSPFRSRHERTSSGQRLPRSGPPRRQPGSDRRPGPTGPPRRIRPATGPPRRIRPATGPPRRIRPATGPPRRIRPATERGPFGVLITWRERTGRDDPRLVACKLTVTPSEEVRPMNAVAMWVLTLPVTAGRLT